MDIRKHFTTEEWAKIESAPFLVGSATALATYSGWLGTMRELNTINQAITKMVRQYPGNRIIQGLMPEKEFEAHAEDETAKDQLEMTAKVERSPEEEAELALSNLSEALTLLQGVASRVEVDQYKYAVRSIGEQVARAAKEGRLFERGVDPISDEEASFLRKVNAILDQA